VQGVGFRYTTVNVAHHYAVAGYVMNLPDGRVELVAEGEEKELKAFLAAVREAMGRYIHNAHESFGQATGEWGDPNQPGSFKIHHA